MPAASFFTAFRQVAEVAPLVNPKQAKANHQGDINVVYGFGKAQID